MTYIGPAVPDLMTSQEVADYLRLPLPTVYYLAKAGKLPCFQVGNRWRFHGKEIERLRNAPSRPPNVLVVDDNPVIQELLEEALTRAGTHVAVTADPDEAFQWATETRFDALLIDLVLGGRRGVPLIRKLQDYYPSGKMVIITGHPDLLETAAVLQLGPMTVLLKPFHLHQVVECVEQIVGRELHMPSGLSLFLRGGESESNGETRQEANRQARDDA